MAKAPTVYDVAEYAGVSIATVSRVLRSPDAVKAATRERVMEGVRFLGYVPSANARGLAARRTNVIGLFFPGHDDHHSGAIPFAEDKDVPIGTDDIEDDENLYYDEVLRGAEAEAARHGFALMVASGDGDVVSDLAGRVDGLAVLAGTVSDELLAHVGRRIPVVILGGHDDDFDHVSANNGPGMRELARHVATKAATIAYVAGAEGPDDAERWAGFSEVATAVQHRGDFTRRSGQRIASEMRELPDAIVCANDQMALGVLDVLERLGIRVPEDVLVTGFDGIAAGRHSRPTLTTVHQPMAELGRAAVQVITARLDEPERQKQSLTLAVRVVLRESCP